MSRVCQGLTALFGMLLAASLAAADKGGTSPPAGAAANSVPIHLAAWSPGPFADVALATPELVACFMLTPGWWSTAAPPTALPDQAALSRILGAQLQAVLASADAAPLSVVVAATENPNSAAVVHGDTALILQPKAEATDAAIMARTLAPAVLLARTRPAAPDPRCDEPLLMIAEAIAHTGSLTLAALPAELRPVRDWLEAKDAAPPLMALASQALDPEVHWQTRRATLLRMSQFGGASPPLASAAALVVEAFGDAPQARAKPFELLLAWRKNSGKEFPPMPRPLRVALEKPLEAGMPKEKEVEERKEIAWDALLRRIQADEIPLSEVPAAAPLPLRFRAAAAARARGGEGLCQWLTSGPLPPVRTGCRSEGEPRGFVFARPREGGFGVYWRSPAGDESLLLNWQRWILFPLVVSSTGELWFVDPNGVWHVPLDGHAAPQLAASGSFRFLVAAPDGTAVVAIRWPSGRAVVIRSTGSQELALDARGGIAFLDADVLVASDGERFSLASLEGQIRPEIFALRCCRSLAVSRGALTVGVSAPCEPGLVRVALNERSTKQLLKLQDGPLGLVPLAGEGYVFGTAEGLWSWPGQGTPERTGAGLTPGPG